MIMVLCQMRGGLYQGLPKCEPSRKVITALFLILYPSEAGFRKLCLNNLEIFG